MTEKIKCYDNGGETADRYTVVFMDRRERAANTYEALGMNCEPYHPQGIGMLCLATPGRHLGKLIKRNELPSDCERLVAHCLSIYAVA